MTLQVLRMYRGDDRAFAMTLTADGEAVDLTGASLRFTASRSDDGEAVIALSTDDGDITITDDAGGEIEVVIPSAATTDLEIESPYLRLLWDVEYTIDDERRTWPEDDNGRPRLGVLRVYRDLST